MATWTVEIERGGLKRWRVSARREDGGEARFTSRLSDLADYLAGGRSDGFRGEWPMGYAWTFRGAYRLAEKAIKVYDEENHLIVENRILLKCGTSLSTIVGNVHLDRQRRHVVDLDGRYGGGGKVIEPDEKHPANVIVSLLEEDYHAVAIDIDMECELVPSRTPGHYHLYIDKILRWDDYQKLLDALAEAGILETRYVEHSKKAGFTALRLPPAEHEYRKLKEKIAASGELFN